MRVTAGGRTHPRPRGCGRSPTSGPRWSRLRCAPTRDRTGAGRAGGQRGWLVSPDTAAYVKASAAVRRGSTHDEIVVTLRVAEGFHVNANPASYDYLIATAVSFDGVDPTRVRFPDAKLFKPAFARRGLSVYEGWFASWPRFRRARSERSRRCAES